MMQNNTTKVLLLDRMSEAQVERFRELTDRSIELGLDREGVDYDMIIGGRLEEELLVNNRSLKAAIIPWAGIPDSYYALLTRPEFSHIAIHNCHYHADLVAEYGFGMLLALAKDLGRKDRALRQGDWRPRYGPSRALRLAGKDVLVLGYGAIGRELGRLCQALGMRVRGTRRSVTTPETDGEATVYPTAELTTLLPDCDVLVNVLPLTPETEGLIGAEELALLKPTALILNVGRAKTFDEVALYDALATGQIHGAALDVWYSYPPDELARAATFPASYPFHQLDNVLLSPHNSAALQDDEHLDYRVEALAQMLNSYAKNDVLPNRVDLARGY